MKLRYVIGDATQPKIKPAIIAHVCNDIGKWGAGFVLALSQKNSQPERAYREWYSKKKTFEDVPFQLGNIQIVPFDEKVAVTNMIGQHGTGMKDGRAPLRYDALEECLAKLYDYAREKKFTVHMPRIGCGLAGGKWEKVEDLIKRNMTVDTYVYDLK